jgi:hypothetical protein
MKVFKIFLILIPVSSLIFYSCTKLDAPYVTVQHHHIGDTIMSWDTIPAVRKVLLEDYTGHKCVNCPEAALTARSLDEEYEGRLLVMAVHAGFYSLPGAGEYDLDLRTPAGNEWNNEFGFISYPNGMVNRKVFESSRILGPDKWASYVGQLINLQPDAQIKITTQYNPDSREVNLTVYNRFITEMNGTYTLTVCILEDSITGAQKNNNPNIGPVPDWFGYVFNDVLRGSVNGSYGEDLATDPDPALTYLGRFETTLASALVPENCWILAFISNKETREIIQSEKKKILP